MVGLVDDYFIKYPINSRVKVHNDYGTVKYLGEVTGYPGLWIGVEWDDPNRGKHDGTTNGYRYFQTEHPTAGSMIRPTKISKYETLEDAIEERYHDENVGEALDKNLIEEVHQYLHASVFEIVGMEKLAKKQSQNEELTDISVAYSTVNSAGDLSSFKRLKSLNLTSTLIWNWQIVSDIVKQIPTLTYINLSSNRFQLPTQKEINELEPNFRHLKHINLSKCRLKTWENVLLTAQLFPYIESLSLEENDIEKIVPADSNYVFKNLRELDLNSNLLCNFDEILKLGNIKSLKILLIMNNGIENVRLPYCDFDKKLDTFPSLEILNLNNNPIRDEIATLNELDKLPALNNLSMISNGPSTFSAAVALLPQLKIFNKVSITKEDRRGAEYDLWKGYGLEWIKTENNPDARKMFCLKYRSYPKLIEKYGSPEEFVSARPQMKASNRVKIRIQNKLTGETIEKSIPRKISVQTLQGLIIKHFKKELIGMPKLSYVDSNHPEIVVQLENLSKTLDYYSIQDGDTVIVEWGNI